MFTILVAEDNKNTARLMDVVLTQNGYQVLHAANGLEVLTLLEEHTVDLILLDIMMPQMDGYEVTRILRENNNFTPILMVTAKDGRDDIRKGFMTGTDDYMTKPVDEVEMLYRIQALLRRAKIAADHELTIGGSKLSYDSHTFTDANGEQILPKKEFQLLFKLLSYPNKTFTKNQLLEEFWGADGSDSKTIPVHINRLRDRFKDNPDFTIVTVHGLGYKAVRKDQSYE